MWSAETRRKYERKTPRYPSDLSDGEWVLVGPLIPPARPEFAVGGHILGNFGGGIAGK